MLGIEKEAAIFLYACLSGAELYLGYRILYCFRCLVRHFGWVINLEDIIYWLAVSAYLFRQMYRTTYGEIRWFFILGVIIGVFTAYRLFRCLDFSKISRKSKAAAKDDENKTNSKKYLEKRKETR